MAWDGLLDDMAQTICETFGQSVLYIRADTGDSFAITAVFDVVYSQSDTGGNIPATIAAKELDIRVRDLGWPPRVEDTVLIAGKLYRIKDVKQSTSGMMKAVLRDVQQ